MILLSRLQWKNIDELFRKELIKGEPDASSFPSVVLGQRLKPEDIQRGIVHHRHSSDRISRAQHCIPAAFCSYTGGALDQKTPLLRSMEAINEQSFDCSVVGNTTSKKVTPSVGPEQEYFIVDGKIFTEKSLIFWSYLIRSDASKGQEMDDHYFGSIREYYRSLHEGCQQELWKLGVSAKTQHNEVAPAQHELAQFMQEANIVAVDHNQLVMETLKKVAYRHGLQCLLHEKPFAGVNGFPVNTTTGRSQQMMELTCWIRQNAT